MAGRLLYFVDNFFVKLIKISSAKTRAMLHPINIQSITLMNIIFQNSCRPLTKLRSPLGAYSITNGNNGLKIMKSDLPGNFSFALFLNYREFLGSCFLINFIFLINIL